MTSTQKSPLLMASKKFKMGKPNTESNARESDMDNKSVIINNVDSTTQSVNTTCICASVSSETLNPDQTINDFNSVCVKIETDEWYNTAEDFYSVCSKPEQVLWENRHPDCKKQDGSNLVHEQTGSQCLQMDKDNTKQYGFTSDCVKSEQPECEVMHQDFTRQPVCVNKNTTAHAYTAQFQLHSVCGKTKQSLNPNTDQSYPTTNDLNYECSIAKQYIKTETDTGNTTANDHNDLCDHKYKKTPENQAELADLNSVFLTRKEIELSYVDQYCARPTVDGETLTIDHYSNLNVQRHSISENDDSEIFIERLKRKRKSCHSTHPATKKCQGSSTGKVQPKGAPARDNAVTRSVPLKPAKKKLTKKGDRVKKVKGMNKAKTPEKDKTEYSLQERNLASCMKLELPDNDHFLYCGECNKGFEGNCPVYGPYYYIQDKEVPDGDTLKADHSLPDCLEIKTSKIAGGGLGVFSKERLKSRILFGPYGSNIITDNHKSAYCWQMSDHDYASHFNSATKTDGTQVHDITLSVEKKSKSNRICCVPKCHTTGYGLIEGHGKPSYHSFPAEDNPLRAVWLNKIRRDEDKNIKITRNTVVCFLHFEPDCLDESGFAKRRYLKPGAIPTLFDCWKDKPHVYKPKTPHPEYALQQKRANRTDRKDDIEVKQYSSTGESWRT
ncbi:uncharacterized protein LOC127833889 isoform X4 [Dreissena polymorpha]|nr:uncharacterized protein LOC127833889 isoform X4 [Dreissena polymorpha]